MPDTATPDLDAFLTRFRPAVRAEKPYLVGGMAEPDVKLNQNESPYDLPEDLKRELLEAFFEVPFNRYPSEQPDAVVQALADHTGHPAEGILVGNGSNELTYLLGLSFIAPGTKVVQPRPMFALYESVVRLFDGDLIGVPPLPDLRFDADAIRKAVQAHDPAYTVLTTPNNPTGRVMTLDEVESIVRVAKGFVVVDEAYVEFNEQPSAQTLMDRYPNVIVMRTLSKAFGLAGLRVGYLMAQPAVVAEMMKARLPFMVDRLAQAAALAMLRRPALLQERVDAMKASLADLRAALQEVPAVEVVPSQANFLLFKTPVEPSEMLGRLAKAGVAVRNVGGYPELKGYLRVNAGTPAENQAFLDALKNAL